MKRLLISLSAVLLLGAPHAFANGKIVAPNGTAQIGVNDDGSLDASVGGEYVGLGYNFTGQGGRSGFQDALTPGCACEAWGVAANGLGGQVGQSTGNQNITVHASSLGTGTFTSNTELSLLPGLTITQTYGLGAQTGTGALFEDTVVLHNGTGSLLTDLQYARAMDWDVPPTEFSEVVTFKGTGTTSALLRSTDNGFAYANPLSAITDGGIDGPINADGTTGPDDHGALFVFGFGDLAAGADYTFNIFYGAGQDKADALALLGQVAPELYNLGQSNNGMGGAADDLPTFVFAFNGVGGSVVVPPVSGAPEPGAWALMLAGVALLGAALRQSAARRRNGALSAVTA